MATFWAVRRQNGYFPAVRRHRRPLIGSLQIYTLLGNSV